MASQQLSEYLSKLSSITTPEIRWITPVLGLVLVLAAYLLQPKEDSIPDNMILKIEAVCDLVSLTLHH